MSNKHILYVQTSGMDIPIHLYMPFSLATTAKSMNIDATIYFLGFGAAVLKKGVAEIIKEGELPVLKEVMDQSIKSGVELMICTQSMKLLRLKAEDLIPEAKLVGFATLNSLALDVDTTMWF